MKKILSYVIFLLLLSLGLTSCGANIPRPQVKEGRFHISITYEHNGEVKEASVVYVCEYKGIARTLEGEPYLKWKESFEGDGMEGSVIPIGNTGDGGEIYISLLLSPEYFMGDPKYADHTPIVGAEIFYEDDQIDDAEILAGYGVRILHYEYDEPVQNEFGV